MSNITIDSTIAELLNYNSDIAIIYQIKNETFTEKIKENSGDISTNNSQDTVELDSGIMNDIIIRDILSEPNSILSCLVGDYVVRLLSTIIDGLNILVLTSIDSTELYSVSRYPVQVFPIAKADIAFNEFIKRLNNPTQYTGIDYIIPQVNYTVSSYLSH